MDWSYIIIEVQKNYEERYLHLRKMKKIKKALLTLTVVLTTVVTSLNAQVTINGSFNYGGINRTYSFYVPASYVQGNPVPMVIGLHGTSSSGSQFAQYRDFRSIADTANFIIVNPDGSTMLGVSFWNYGNVLGSTVDDVGFLEALIDTISAQYTINPNRIYCTGMSNGSFMAYALACQSNRFAAVAGITGSMSVNMYNNCNPVRPIPTMHIHGTDDAINPYTGTSTMKAIEDVTLFWVNQNNCNIVPTITSIPDIDINDDATAERHLYEGGINGHTVELFKVTGGGHSWPNSPMPSSSEITCMDFDACTEIWRFFSQHEISNTTSVESHKTSNLVSIYPNPVNNVIHFSVQTNVKLINLTGQIIARKMHVNTLDISEQSAGIYFVILTDDKGQTFQRSKIVKK